MAEYVIDTSIWIRLWRNHPPDIFAGLWKQLDASIAQRTIVSPDEVLRELERGTDDLASVLAERKELFARLDEALMVAVSEVLAVCPALADPDAERNRADPFVVALAKLRNGVAVSAEQPRRVATGRPKIPDACKLLGVDCLDWFGFLRAIGWKL